MRRRDFIKLATGAAISPQVSFAQSSKVPRLGFLGATSARSWASRMESLRTGLRRLGYEQGENILIEDLWAEEQYNRLPELAAELVRRKVDVILTYGTPGTLAAKRATTDIPIVFVYAGDAVGAGLVTNLSRPEANVTGNTYFLPELMSKRLELMKETIPDIKRVAFLVKPDNPLFNATLPVIRRTADALKIDLQEFEVRNSAEFEPAMAAMVSRSVEGIIIQEDAVYLTNRGLIVDLATRHSLPVASSGEFGDVGALIGYGANFHEMCKLAALFVDKLLRGARPSDLPVDRATKFETVLNAKAAKTLGLSLSSLALLRADRVIE